MRQVVAAVLGETLPSDLEVLVGVLGETPTLDLEGLVRVLVVVPPVAKAAPAQVARTADRSCRKRQPLDL